MKNGARYVVTTHWGTFSLDEGSYQDYLAGNHWICWTPGKPKQAQIVTNGYVPPNVTDRAIALREQADRIGVLATLHQLGVHDAIAPYSTRLSDLSIDEMNLTVRSSNGLKRANAGTFGRLKELLAMENGILSVRNLGQKSAKEIKQLFFEECYPCNPSAFRSKYKAAIEAIEGVRYLSPHSCRHTYVSQMQSLGVDLATIQSLVGHADVDMTKHYLHVQDPIKLAAIAKFDKEFSDEPETQRNIIDFVRSS